MTAVAKPYSLLKRLTVAFSIVALLAFALVGGFMYNALALELQRHDDMEIAEKLDQFLQQARDFSVAPGRHDQHAAYSCNPPTIGSSRCIYADETLPSGETIRILLAHVASERHSLLRSYQEDVWLAIAAGAILMGALGYAIARQGLSPVKTIGHQTSSIEAHRLNERLDIAAGPVELQEIATSVNRMLDRLERAFLRLSQFSSDLAHDMRTPLANVISSSQVTLSRTRTTED